MKAHADAPAIGSRVRCTSRDDLGTGAQGVDYVSCQLCGRNLRTLNNGHLVRIHGFPADEPVQAYRRAHPRSPTWCLRTRQALSAALVRFRRLTRKVWTKHEIVEKIRKLHHEGKALGVRSVGRNYPGLKSAGVKLFGSWVAALASSGLDPARVRQHRRWSPRELIAAVRARGRSGRSLAYRTVHLEDTGLVKAAVRIFGTWDAALRVAGLSVEQIRGNRAWDPDSILAAIREGARKVSPEKLYLRDRTLFAIACRYFRNWRNALEYAGVVPRTRWPALGWSRRKVSSEIRRYVRGRNSLAWKAIFRKRPELVGAAVEAFGSWRAAVTAAGFRVSRPMTRQEWTRPELRRLLVELHKRHGTVTPGLLRQASPDGYASPAIHVVVLFGSLKNALRKIRARERRHGEE